jgi:hypothetical protein
MLALLLSLSPSYLLFISLWVIYLTWWITLATCSSSALPMLVCFHVFYRLTGKHLPLLVDVISEFKSFSEAPRLARKYGTRRSDSPVRAL